jgi:protein-S-isoprenylcysteine O-methyltransferase Ste14
MRLLERTPRGPRAPAEDRGSLRIVILGFASGMFLAFRLAFGVRGAALPWPPVWFVLGLATMVAGALLRRHCFRVLGRFFTGAVTIQADHRLIDTGAYRFLRHPSYSAALLIIVGFATALGNWASVLAAFVCAFCGYAWRARVEERALLAALGEPYARFMAARKRFIPLLY